MWTWVFRMKKPAVGRVVLLIGVTVFFWLNLLLA
jgi:hypothetical protein